MGSCARVRGFAPLLALAVLGCGTSREPAVHVVGSTSILPFAELLAEEFARREPGIHVEVQGGGSTHGLLAVASGIAEIGACSRSLHREDPAEAQFTPVPIAQDAIAVVVHPSNPLSGLSRAQLRALFSGQAANWRDVGGADAPVRVITREEGSGTLDAFLAEVMGATRITPLALVQESNGAMKEVVKQDPCAVGFMSMGLVGLGLKALAVDGAAPSASDAARGGYPLVRPFLFVVKGAPSGAARRFIEFARSPEAHQLIEQERMRNATSLVRGGGRPGGSLPGLWRQLGHGRECGGLDLGAAVRRDARGGV